MRIRRNRPVYCLLIGLTVGLGLFSRSKFIPESVHPYLGDMLYAILIFFLLGFTFPQWTSIKVMIISLIICYVIETSQFYQADWINEIRSYSLGGLILGYGFLWSDIISYSVGGIVGLIFEKIIYRKRKESHFHK